MTVSVAQIREIRRLSGGCCEYCLLAPNVQLATFQIDHIIPIKHGGLDASDNLCLACLDCSSYKGPNVAAIDPDTESPTRLYSPREQEWDDHFELNVDMTMIGLTPEGRATIAVLRMNMEHRIIQRYEAWIRGEYPCEVP